MFLQSSWSRMSEKAEGRIAGYVPMVYEKVSPKPVSWEYHLLTIDTREMALPGAEQLNELGGEGWILAGMLDERTSGSGKFVHYYFARQRID
jgi:hypothetical protein